MGGKRARVCASSAPRTSRSSARIVLFVALGLLTACEHRDNVELNPPAKTLCRAYEDASKAWARAREHSDRTIRENDDRLRRVGILREQVETDAALGRVDLWNQHRQEISELMHTISATNRKDSHKYDDASTNVNRAAYDVDEARRRATKPSDIAALDACKAVARANMPPAL